MANTGKSGNTPAIEEKIMSFSLPELPYPYDALAPYMSRETLEFHHDKHHLAYVDNANNLMKGTEFDGRSVDDVVRGLVV